MILPKDQSSDKNESNIINSVSVILLSFNGKNYLNEKINFLLNELSCFEHYEIIIVDDNSSDGSKELLSNFLQNENIRIILKSAQKGIPHTMNIGVKNAKYSNIVFCDQRQNLSKNIIKRLVEPLNFKKIGAVSACIAPLSKGNCESIIRRHENFLKSKESEVGNLIGVYGPLYSIKKVCYSPIPEYIYLDDLYLSLIILRSKKIKIISDCEIIDEDLSVLYDYKRTKRYLNGFLQLLKEKDLIRNLSYKQIIMLFWHKYLRLFIPLFLFVSYICTGVKGISHPVYMVLFGIVTTFCVVSVLPNVFKIRFKMRDLIRINIFYFFALFDLSINQAIKSISKKSLL